MFSKVRQFLRNRSPDWLNTEVNKDLVQNLSGSLSKRDEKDIQESQEQVKSSYIKSASGQVKRSQKKSNMTTNLPLMTDDCSLMTVKGTPHWRRIRQVFQALDTAPETATYNELIGYVRETTGKGCSRKLISKWKKQRISHQSSDISHQLGSTTNKQEISGLEAATNIISSPRAIAYNQISQSSIISATPSTVSSLHLAKSSNKSTSKKSLMTDDWSLMTVLTAGITIALVGCEIIPFNNNRPTENVAIASVTTPLPSFRLPLSPFLREMPKAEGSREREKAISNSYSNTNEPT